MSELNKEGREAGILTENTMEQLNANIELLKDGRFFYQNTIDSLKRTIEMDGDITHHSFMIECAESELSRIDKRDTPLRGID